MSSKPLGTYRRAEWRRRADDPKGLLGWWWNGFWREGGLFFLQLLALILLFVGAGTNARWTPLTFLALGVTSILAKKFTARSDTSILLPEASAESFRSSVIYRQEGISLGSDFLSLSFVDGWLYAEGLRSTFALRAQDVSDLSGKFDLGCVLTLIDGSRIDLRSPEDRERRALEAWHEAQAQPEGESTFPPLGRIRERWRDGDRKSVV